MIPPFRAPAGNPFSLRCVVCSESVEEASHLDFSER